MKKLSHAGESHPRLPDDASLLAVPRLIICISGTATFLTGNGRRQRRIVLRPRHGLAIPGGCWVKATPTCPYRTLGFVFQADTLRVYISRGRRTDGCWHPLMEDSCSFPRSPEPLFQEWLRRGVEDDSGSFASVRTLAASNLLLCECHTLCLAGQVESGSPPARRWAMAEHFIQEHLHEHLDRPRVAAHLNIHPNHLSRLCKSRTGIPFSSYLLETRLVRARELLRNPRLNISEIAYLCGFASPNYFIRSYRARHGVSPGKDR